MNQKESFEQFLASTSARMPVLDFAINIIIAAVLAFILAWVYVRYGNALSNRKMFSRNFFLLTVTTMMVISIVKSSLALSLGLVGALSIVRFRAAIKDPEELTYLFFAIAIGLGLGADQVAVTLAGFIIVVTIILLKKKIYGVAHDNQTLFLSVSSKNPGGCSLESLVDAIKQHCNAVNLKRFDETEEYMEALFLIDLADFNKLSQIKNVLKKFDKALSVSFLDNKGS